MSSLQQNNILVYVTRNSITKVDRRNEVFVNIHIIKLNFVGYTVYVQLKKVKLVVNLFEEMSVLS